MRIIAIGTGPVSGELADRLGAPRVSRIHDVASDDFVLDGTGLDAAAARALDALLRGRASEVDAVLWLAGGDPELLEHYRGRVIELDPIDPLESALAGLREVMLAS